jgi:imidazolonepropionase-like amidohydrolase
MFSVWLTACAHPLAGPIVLENARLMGGQVVAVEIRDGRFSAVGEVPASALERVDMRGAYLVPAFVDSHVHLAYFPVGEELADGGVAAAVDLAAPIEAIATPLPQGPKVWWSGPMITAKGGYPTTSWGAGGYGLEVVSEDAAAAAVKRLHEAGARLIKVPIEEGGLTDATLARIVNEAHARSLLVVAHALDDAGASRAADAGVDGLAHTPTELLSEATVAKWSGRFVISTLRAFGSFTAPTNLRALRAAGATVLYGTDLGNTREPRIDEVELGLLREAGLDGAAIVEAGTRAPAERWGFAELGAIEVGKAASFLVLEKDPAVDPLGLAKPKDVWIDGVRR